VIHRKLGDPFADGEPLCTIHYNSETQAGEAATLLVKSFHIADVPAEGMPLIHRVIGTEAATRGEHAREGK
jgi:thymidine phosphorylase